MAKKQKKASNGHGCLYWLLIGWWLETIKAICRLVAAIFKAKDAYIEARDTKEITASAKPAFRLETRERQPKVKREENESEGSTMDIFGKKKAQALQDEIDQLKKRNAELESMMTPEMRDLDTAKTALKGIESHMAESSERLKETIQKVSELNAEKTTLEKQVVDLDNIVFAQDFGLYKPRYKFANSTKYRDELKKVRDKQRAMLKDFNEQAKQSSWTVQGDAKRGKRMIRDMTKLVMRCFNSDCDDLINKVKASNIERTTERIRKSADSISNLGKELGISIPPEYVALKVKEAYLAYEFALEKEKEKEAIREAREREREELKVKKEIEAQRKKLEKEKQQYKDALKQALQQQKDSGTTPELEEKISALKANLVEVDAGIADVDYREANQRAGYVYVISNIGSFGEGVYKIGMTRRLDPMERVRELGDASVPFTFDVHALIFSDDAPKLEAALHRKFADRRVNMVNNRREFFRVSLDEIEKVVMANYDKTVEFTETAEAEQYRESEAMRKERE